MDWLASEFMSAENEKDLANTRDLFDFLQGNLPEGYQVAPDHMPKLTADQAATVIWYLGNQYWQVTDHVERCEVCGDWYNTWCEGECLDFGNAPYHFCGNCCEGEEAQQKRRVGRGLERAKKRQCLLANIEVSRAHSNTKKDGA